MRRALWTALLAAAMSFAAGASLAQAPWEDWRTIETVHYRIHFPAPFEPWARHAAASIESIHERVTGLVGYSPAPRIDVVISDPIADANGMAIPFLDRPRIVLWTSPPQVEEGLADFTDWMTLLATHEVAHVVHLSRPRNRAPRWLERLSPAPFGPLAIGSPRWVVEGYATLVEGALTGSGRPASSFRAMVLREFAAEGRLPAYSDLSGSAGWLGGSMAYLAGSAYLEWLAAREGGERLPALWKRMASRRGGSFDESFRAVFGESPRDLYGRFTADLTARAVAEENRLKAEGLVEGEAWQRLRGGTLAPEVSRDGARLLVRRDPSPSESYLAVWEIAESEKERRADANREKREAEIAKDPEEAADRPERPLPRRPRWTLPRQNGYSASDPRFLRDGESVLFARRGPDAEGVLRWDLHRWTLASGRVERITRLADVRDPDPDPDGRFAIAVRGRYGFSSLARVDLSTGAVSDLDVPQSPGETWRVWAHPRVSPEGSRIAALLHRGGRWRLVVLPVEGGDPVELPLGAAPQGPPAWSDDGRRIFVATDAGGVWDIAALDASGGRPAAAMTRVTGGAFAPAPSPDGRSLYFLAMTAKGVDLRRLDLEGSAPTPGAAPPAPSLLAAPAASGSPALAIAESAAPEPRAYDAWTQLTVRPFVNFAVGPSGVSVQPGADAGDTIGRLHAMAGGSLGDAAGPRGGMGAIAWRGWPVAIAGQGFTAIEKPGAQGLAPRPELDSQRSGGWLSLEWGRPFAWGRVSAEAGGGGTRVEAFAQDRSFWRALGSAAGALALRRTRGRWGWAAALDAFGAAGSTDGGAWQQGAGSAALSGITPAATLTGSGRWGGTGGTPSAFDVFWTGGAPSLLFPEGMDRNRILSPALPSAVQVGRSLEGYRAELAAAEVPVSVYGEWMRAWSAGERPGFVRAAGAEVRLDRLVPAEFGRRMDFRVGGAWITSETPRINAGRGYALLVYRP
ncbi:MAG TPA: hypothetical protein VH854_02590 [Thermoanaerobaculia bacterium]|nr:hypothetical protein [Thermoanaerobaculia bacterium]